MLSLFSFLFVFSKGREKSILSTFLPGGGRRRRRRRRRKGFVTEGCWTTPELDRYRGRLSFLGPWNWRRKNTERMPSSPPPPPPPPRAATPSRKTGTTVFTPVLDVIRLRIRVSPVIVSPSPPTRKSSLQLIYAIRANSPPRSRRCCCYDTRQNPSRPSVVRPIPTYLDAIPSFFLLDAIAIERNPIFFLSLFPPPLPPFKTRMEAVSSRC